MKKLLIVLAVLAVIAGAGLFLLTRFLNTPEFRQRLLGLVHTATGAKVDVNDIRISIFRGIDLQDVTVHNPEGFAGNMLTAKSFALHYRLWPLLQRRVEVETLALSTPVITLAKNDKGEWNYEKFGGEAKTTTEKPGAPKPAEKRAGGIDLAFSRIEMKDATLVMLDKSQKELLRLSDASFSSSVEHSGSSLTGHGQASIDLINAANSLFVRNVAAPVEITSDAVKLAPLTGKLADGNVTGDAALLLSGDSTYAVNLQVKDADVVKLIQEAGVAKKVFTTGKLQLNTALTGTGGLETIHGSGKAEITGGQLVDIPLLNLLGTLLQVSALQNLKFDECVMEYTIADNVMQTPVIRLKSPQVLITGAGSVALADYSLNHTLTLALAKGALDKAPKEVRQLFTERPDGFLAIEFKVWGPYDKPKTDLDKRILKGVGEQLLDKGLKQLLK
jgi:uncharacterized protein involved in outer membrane biogenesis